MKRKERDCNNDNEEEDEKDTNASKLKLDSLPLDLNMDILARLSAKSLMKFRFVSKMWSTGLPSSEAEGSLISSSLCPRSNRS